jgi:hypothetical protein
MAPERHGQAPDLLGHQQLKVLTHLGSDLMLADNLKSTKVFELELEA